ncbi:MAG: DUF72 domain-containing protein [Bauldia sp.]
MPTDTRIGCSGWHYDGWIGPFYPKGTRKTDLLRAYAERFATAEINNSFYRLPSERAVARWREQVPDGFLFAWKGSRFVTHYKKLLDVRDSIALITGRMDGLGDAFGPVLWQLPPFLKPDLERLARFLDLLPKRRLHAVEFRDPTWYEEPTLRVLRDHGIALCISDHADAPAPFEVTADHVYLRGHGPGGRYHGRYPEKTLHDWARRIRGWSRRGTAVFCYFDNDVEAAAPRDAEALVGMVGGRAEKRRSA